MKLFRNMSHKTRKEIVGYTLVGLLGLGVDYAVFYLLIGYSVPIVLAQWCASFAGFTHNHVWHHYKIFSHSQKMARTYTLSIIFSFCMIILTGPLLVFLQQGIDSLAINKALVIGIMAIIQYAVRKKWIFLS